MRLRSKVLIPGAGNIAEFHFCKYIASTHYSHVGYTEGNARHDTKSTRQSAPVGFKPLAEKANSALVGTCILMDTVRCLIIV